MVPLSCQMPSAASRPDRAHRLPCLDLSRLSSVLPPYAVDQRPFPSKVVGVVRVLGRHQPPHPPARSAAETAAVLAASCRDEQLRPPPAPPSARPSPPPLPPEQRLCPVQRRCRPAPPLPWDFCGDRLPPRATPEMPGTPRQVSSSQSSQSRCSGVSGISCSSRLTSLPQLRSCLKKCRHLCEHPHGHQEVTFSSEEREDIEISRPPSAAVDVDRALTECEVLPAAVAAPRGACHDELDDGVSSDETDELERTCSRPWKFQHHHDEEAVLGRGIADWSMVQPDMPTAMLLGRTWRGTRRNKSCSRAAAF